MLKKGGSYILIALTLVFAAFVCGMLCGRNLSGKEVTVQISNHEVTVPSNQPSASSDEKININTASARLLDTLPGIGPVLAQRIVDYREANGPFQDITELANVQGIGADKLTDIYKLICVED